MINQAKWIDEHQLSGFRSSGGQSSPWMHVPFDKIAWKLLCNVSSQGNRVLNQFIYCDELETEAMALNTQTVRPIEKSTLKPR